MKKINKLQINPEKLMKNEELTALRGGSVFRCKVECDDYQEERFSFSSNCYQWDPTCAANECKWFFEPPFHNCLCYCGLTYA